VIPANHDAIVLLLGLIALIVLAIFTPFILKAFKKKKPTEQVAYKETTPVQEEGAPGATVEPARKLEPVPSAKPVEAVPPLKFEEALKEVEEENKNLKQALSQTQHTLFGRIRNLFGGDGKTPELDDIEEVLYTSDLGPKTVERLMDSLRENLSSKEKTKIDTIRATLRDQMSEIFEVSIKEDEKIHWAKQGPTVIMIVGVNGAGKTTTIGKLSAQWAEMGHKVLVAAGDTFRAAAGAQLKVWTERAQVDIFSPEGVTDPAAVAFDAVSKAKAQGFDIVLVDTAGRLHTQAPLMEELKKVKRVMGKVVEDAPHETFIVLDANSGQNALIQAKEFHNALTLTGAVLTKMDGTAKGGVAVGLANELKIPIKYIGVGERIRDLRTFSYTEFIDSIVGEP
jgi:fused signal recognition particle receptor